MPTFREAMGGAHDVAASAETSEKAPRQNIYLFKRVDNMYLVAAVEIPQGKGILMLDQNGVSHNSSNIATLESSIQSTSGNLYICIDSHTFIYICINLHKFA